MIYSSDTLVILTINIILISPGYTICTLNTSKPGDVTLSVITGDEGIPTERERGEMKIKQSNNNFIKYFDTYTCSFVR